MNEETQQLFRRPINESNNHRFRDDTIPDSFEINFITKQGFFLPLLCSLLSLIPG